jgi:regulator of sigma E protease
MIVSILLGIVGLGLVVLVHEFGHFVAARAAGVEVETFSIGWGPRLVGWKGKHTDFCVSIFPLGGYCRMKGEAAFAAAIQNKSETIPREPGTFYGAPAWKRILISFAGPAFNVLFAAIVFMAVAGVGYTSKSYGNRIVLASEYSLDGSALPATMPANQAGLQTGDEIVSADGKRIGDYSDLQEAISLAADRSLKLGVLRGGQAIDLAVRPKMDKDTGAGKIGIYSWIDPLVQEVAPASAAARAGLAVGDRIVAVDGKSVSHGIQALSYLKDKPERALFTVIRNGQTLDLPVVLSWGKDGSDLGIGFSTISHTVKSPNFGAAIADGLAETGKTIGISFQSMGLLFRGVNVLKAVSGPAHITYLVGETATSSIAESGASGLAVVFNFLALLSIALFIMNLLPIPALDGGMILLYVIELIKQSPLRTKTVYRFQVVGMAFIFGLFALAAMSDILFFSGK